MVVVGVCGAVGCAEIGLGFDDATGEGLAGWERAREGLAEQGAGDGYGVASVEASGEAFGLFWLEAHLLWGIIPMAMMKSWLMTKRPR